MKSVDRIYTNGAVRNSHLGYFSAVEADNQHPEIPFSAIVSWNRGDLGKVTYSWNCVSICVCQHPLEQMIAIGEYGEAVLLGSDDLHDEIIQDINSVPIERGPLRDISNIEGFAVAAGMDRQVYIRKGIGQWVDISSKIRPEKDEITGFEAVAGSSLDNIYAVGWNGEIWHFLVNNWIQLDSPTNIILTDLECVSDNEVYVAGRLGTLLKIVNNNISTIRIDNFKEDIWSISLFQNKLYVATLTALYTFDPDLEQLNLVKFENEVPSSFGSLSVSLDKETLWSIGEFDIMSYDDSEWSRIV